MMSNASSDQALSLSAAGRKFKLGMVYDAKTNKLVPTLNVLDNCHKVVTKSRLCPSQTLDLKSSYTMNERMELFQFDGNMKVGLAFGFLELKSASGKYVSDMSSSIGQSRMTLQYKQTKRYEELDTATVLKLCDNIELLKLARENGATHFVAGITYGNQVLMDFKCTKQRYRAHDQLDIQIKGIFSIGQFLADRVNKDEGQIITFDDIQCEIFCESIDIEKPFSFNEAKKIYEDLPKTLQNVEVVDRVHLLPLSIIDKDANRFNTREINTVVINRLVYIRDDLHEHELLCDDFRKKNIDVSNIKYEIQKYTEQMKQSLSTYTTPKDWSIVISKHNNSPFESGNLHKRIKEEARSKTVVCPVCARTVYEGSEFDKHMKTHEVVCPVCGRRVHEGSEFDKHMKTHEVVCPVCDLTVYDGREFDKHMKTHKVVCPVCGKKVYGEIELDKHMKTHEVVCPVCGKAAYERSEFDKHMKTHEVVCPVCGKTVFEGSEFDKHMKTHEVVCPVCSKAVYDGSEFDKHMKIHNVVCPVCGRRVHEGSEFDKHMKTHEVVCLVCGKTVYDGSDYDKHMETHEVVCLVCGRRVHEGSEFDKHMKTHEEKT